MTTAATPAAALDDDAYLHLAFGATELAERPGDLFDTYLVRKISAEALVEAVEAVGAKIAKRLPAAKVRAYADAYDGPAMNWCAEHRTWAVADRLRCREVEGSAEWETPRRCYLAPAEAVTVEVRVEGLPVWDGEWAVGGILTRDAAGAVVATAVGVRHDDALFAHRYSHLMGECTHCGLNRRRNTTVLLTNGTGEVRPVGKTCLTEYTGGAIRVEALAAMTSLRERFATEIGGVLTAEDDTAPTVDIVALALRYIDIEGRYVKVEDYDPRAIPTASRVREALCHSDNAPRPKVMACDLTDRDRATARDMIELVMRETSDSSYILNLQSVAQYDWAQITGRRNRVGLLASLPVAAMNIREREARAAAKAAAEAARAGQPNGWIGKPGERRNFAGTIVTAKEVAVDSYSPYGGTDYKTLLVIDTAEGAIKVFGSVNWPGQTPDLDALVGKPIDLTGTIAKGVKAYGEFRGVKQTNVQRVRVAKVG